MNDLSTILHIYVQKLKIIVSRFVLLDNDCYYYEIFLLKNDFDISFNRPAEVKDCNQMRFCFSFLYFSRFKTF